jgi:hypothetical protein
MKMKLATIMLCLQGLVSALQAQQIVERRLRNSIELSYSYSTWFTGRVFQWDHVHKSTKPHFFSPGFTIRRSVGVKGLILELSYRRLAGRYNGPFITPNSQGLQLYSSGDITGRLSWHFSFALHYPLIYRQKINWHLLGDITFRHGYEDMVLSNHYSGVGWPEIIGITMPQNDLGLSLGTRFTWFPHRRIAISTDWRYTRFVLRYYQPDPRYSWDKGTTKNLLMAQFKVGFCF